MITTQFKKDDIVLFYVKTKNEVSRWHKGIISSNNFPMMNEPNELTPQYYIIELDIDEDHYIGNNTRRYYAVDADDKNIIMWHPCLHEFFGKEVEDDDITEMHIIIENELDGTNNVIYDKLCEISIELRQLHDKMDLIFEKVRKLETPTYIPYEPYPQPYRYNPDDFKIYCDTKTDNKTTPYTSNMTPEEKLKYQECYSNSTELFNYNKYNDMCTCTDDVDTKYDDVDEKVDKLNTIIEETNNMITDTNNNLEELTKKLKRYLKNK